MTGCLFKRFLGYPGMTWFIHACMWVVLTPWFFFSLNFTPERYTAWVWQAPIYAPTANYPLGLLIERFIPWYRKVIKRRI